MKQTKQITKSVRKAHKCLNQMKCWEQNQASELNYREIFWMGQQWKYEYCNYG